MTRFFALALVISLLFPNLAYAQNATSSPGGVLKTRSSSASANKQAAISERTQKGIERADKEIERRITSLNELIVKINALKKLSASNKSTYTSQIQAEIDSLSALKAKIDSDTDIDTLKTDIQSIVKEYRIYLLYIPKMRILVAADRLGIAADTLTNYSATLSAKINDAKASGKDVVSEEDLLSDLNSKVADAKSMYQKAVSLITPLTPDGWPDNKTTLNEARNDIKTGTQYLKSAFLDAVNIRRALVGKSVVNDSSASGSSAIKISPLKK